MTSSNRLRRPESEYSRHRRQNDQNPRYKYENISSNELDLPDKTTQEYEGPGMISRLDGVLGMNLNADDGEEVSFANSENGTPNPYLFYNPETGGASATNNGHSEREEKRERKSKSKSSSSSSSGSSRPKSASRKR